MRNFGCLATSDAMAWVTESSSDRLGLMWSCVCFCGAQIGVPQESLGKLICRQPQVLTYSEDSMRLRLDFLRGLGIDGGDLTKAVVSHPQVGTAGPAWHLLFGSVVLSVGRLAVAAKEGGLVSRSGHGDTASALLTGMFGVRLLRSDQVLQYRVEAMQEKVSYLRHIGMGAADVPVCLMRLPQLLCLDVRNNLIPKYNYLTEQMGGTVRSVTTFPAYFSLSLPGRCVCCPAVLSRLCFQSTCPKTTRWGFVACGCLFAGKTRILSCHVWSLRVIVAAARFAGSCRATGTCRWSAQSRSRPSRWGTSRCPTSGLPR